ncbi:MAG TPA: VCBS repeat-containing protein [Puia sp.]|nr:VCBS repeat-containing protein [Puia sp.]
MRKFLLSWMVLAVSCHPGPAKTYNRNRSHADVKEETLVAGEALAAKYCQSCHQLPSPDLLDATTWEKGVLPQMGPRLGIFEYKFQRYPNNSADPNVGRGFYPAAPLLSGQDWGAIIDYYTALSPDTLPSQQRKDPLRANDALFRVEMPAQRDSSPPATCLIKYDADLHQIFTADIIQHAFNRWDERLQKLPAREISGAIVDMAADSSGYMACNIGAFSPNNAKTGHIDHFNRNGKELSADHSAIYSGLMRPVNIVNADLNGDGKQDIVVCEFGFIKGALSWLENKGGGQYEKHVLRSVPGAIRAVVQDYNHDGLPDIWVLFAQGDEGIFLYTNKGHGQFVEQAILHFPPSYGSSYFELDDFNRDGNPDILYTCGDNGDFSTVLKPYHGVYIFMGDSAAHFTQQYFFPINGCYRAMARDFDGSGNLSIVAIAYFADYEHQPEESCVYLQNKGKWQFIPYSVPGTGAGRWITMDVADLDGDGKTDILLSNCSVGPSFIKSAIDWKKGPAFMVLKNRMGNGPSAGKGGTK